MKGKFVKESAIEDYVYEVFPNDLNPQGTIYGGRVMFLIDGIAGVVARRHAGKICLTVSMDTLNFLRPVKSGEIMIFKAAVNRVWNTSCEVGVKLFVENQKTKEKSHVASAYLTFVAVDEDGRPTSMVQVIPKTQEEKRRFREAEERRKARLEIRESIKSKTKKMLLN